MKGRIFTNGAPHCKFVPREEAKSPTITLEGLLSTIVIDSYEDRKVETFIVPGSYLHTDMPKEKFMLLLLGGKFVDVMCYINPDYKQHVRFKDGRKTLHLRIIKAMNRMIDSDILL